MKQRLQKYLLEVVFFFLISILSYAFIALIGASGVFSSLFQNVNDIFTYKTQYTENHHEDRIVIIKIDDASLDALGGSDVGMLSFDKGSYAEVIENLFEVYGASSVGVDIVFANPSVYGAADEQKLQEVLMKYQDRVIIASRSDYTPHPLCLYADANHGIIQVNQGDKIRDFTLHFPDYDISKVCPEQSTSEVNTSGARILSAELATSYAETLSPLEKNSILKNIEVFQERANAGQENLIQFYHTPGDYTGTLGFESYSFIDILQQKSRDAGGREIDLRDKVILIGEVGTLIHDSHFVPALYGVKMPGVEIHANIFETLLSGTPLVRAGFVAHFLLFLVGNICIMYGVFRLRILFATAIYVLIIIALVVGVSMAFYVGTMYDLMQLFLSLTLSGIVAYIYRFQITDKSKRQLKKTFSLYVSPDVVHEITQHPDEVSTVGEKREISIFFSDIVSFTSISESTDPEVLLELLNEYFSEMTGILLRHKGTLDKYIGDAIMGFFNAPVLQENHSYEACCVAVEQQLRLKQLNKQWQEKGYPHIAIRIGLHCGEAVHGNIGSTQTRLNYTVIGDSVNLASRLEGIGKYYGVFITVSEDIYHKQKENFVFRQLDKITVKGKDIPVQIYELIGKKEDSKAQEYYEQTLRKYEHALEMYYQGDYELAGAIFDTLADIDAPSKVMAQRCEDATHGKIQINQGVFTMTQK